MMGEYVIPQILGYGQDLPHGQRAGHGLPRGAQLAQRRGRAVGLILIMFVDHHGLPVVREPRSPDP